VPSQLKAWIDRILVAGRTFRYTATGPEGLAAGKRVIVALSRGGFYGAGSPAAGAEHVESYLRAVFGLMGVTDVEFVLAEGVQVSPEHREKALSDALAAAKAVSPRTRAAA
jgi:FMN-dependent NADH-azoreductase